MVKERRRKGRKGRGEILSVRDYVNWPGSHSYRGKDAFSRQVGRRREVSRDDLQGPVWSSGKPLEKYSPGHYIELENASARDSRVTFNNPHAEILSKCSVRMRFYLQIIRVICHFAPFFYPFSIHSIFRRNILRLREKVCDLL